MHIGGITKRWVLNTFSIVLLVLTVVAISVSTALYNHYYSSVAIKLKEAASDVTSTFMNLYNGDTGGNLLLSGSHFIDSFTDKAQIGVWIIDREGRVILSSSGFELSQRKDLPDLKQTLQQEGQTRRLTLPSGEQVMETTVVLHQTEGQIIGGVCLFISLEDISAQLQLQIVLVIIGVLLTLLLLLLSGSFFVKSIVNPLKKIGETAQQIAGGDLRARIDHYYYNDEVGALCETINNMAQELETADRIKNDFISTVSHELRTPLTAIRGWGETLLQVGDTDEVAMKRGINIIISESTRLGGIVEELLDFSRMQSGRLQMKSERMDVLAELDEIVFTMKERAIREGIEIVYTVPHFPIPMLGDSGRIRQVFVNILDNAIKYNEPGGRILVLAEVKSEALVEISVSDTGRGIASADLAHIKEKFFKADNTVRGSGIGLAVADEIVRLHNGTLTVDSILGTGTTVTIQLPTEKIVLPEELVPEEKENQENEQTEEE